MRKIWPGRRGSSGEFIFTINTALGSHSSRSANNQFYIPIQDGSSGAGFTVNFIVDWGDGSTSYVNASNYLTTCLHTYTTQGIYTIKCSGTVAGWAFQNGSPNVQYGDQEKMLTIENWGCFKMDGGRAGGAGLQFWGCSNMGAVNCTDIPYMGRSAIDNFNVASKGLRGTFASCSNLVRINRIADWPVRGDGVIANILFDGCTKLQFGDLGTGIIDLTGWDMKASRTLERMFSNCAAFNGKVPPNIGTAGTGFSAMRTEQMFNGCTNFTGTNGNEIQSWKFDAGFAANGRTDRMFKNCPVFNADISGWNPSKIINMDEMFENATSFNQNIGGWDVSNVNRMIDMLSGASSFDQDISSWNVNAWSVATAGGSTTALGRNLPPNNFQLSTANYNALLIAWDSSYTFPSWPGGTVDFGDSQYSLGTAAATARANLITTWGAILDGGGV